MKILAVLAAAFALAFTVAVDEAEAAKRLGAGRSAGMQRQMTPPTSPASAPSASAAAKAPGAAAAPTTPGRSWLGPVAGLAAGLGLAALASHFGFGGELASIMMMALIAFVVIALIGFVMRKRGANGQPLAAGAASKPWAYAGEQNATAMARSIEHASQPQSAAPAANLAATRNGNVPADFDVAGFVRSAKANYIRLQAANDAGNLDDIRTFTTPEMFAEIKLALNERNGVSQVTDVVAIEADVVDVTEEDKRYIVSVRFTGQIREDHGPAESIDEIWHLVKPRDGSSGWQLAGIQQSQ